MTTASSSPTATQRPLSRRSGQSLAPLSRQCWALQSRRQKVKADVRGSSTPFQGSCRWAPLSLTPRRWTTPALAPPVPWAPGRCQWQCSGVVMPGVTGVMSHCDTLHTALGSHYLCLRVDCSRDCRTSGVSSGATSGSGGSNPGYWHHQGLAQHQDQRKFTTLNRNQQKTKTNPILRTRSFQISQQQINKLSPFSPSENSAFHSISAGSNKDLSQVNYHQPINLKRKVLTSFKFQASKFVTSTPVKCGPWPQVSRRRAGNIRNVFPSPVASGAPMSAPAKGNNIMTHALSCVLNVVMCRAIIS